MADNFAFTVGAGAQAASDDIGGVHYPRAKIGHGVDGSYVDVSTTDPMPVGPSPANFISGVTSAMTGTTSTSLIAAPGSGLRNYITAVWVSNSHATVGTDIELQDGSGGTTFAVLPAAAVYGGAAAALPTPLKQPTVNTALYVKNTTTGASTRVTAIGYKSA